MSVEPGTTRRRLNWFLACVGVTLAVAGGLTAWYAIPRHRAYASLFAAIESNDRYAIDRAVKRLHELGAAKQVIQIAFDMHEECPAAFYETLRDVGRCDVAVIVGTLEQSSDIELKQALLRTLVVIATVEPRVDISQAVPVLIRQLGDSASPELRLGAAEALGVQWPRPAPATAALLDAINDVDPLVSIEACKGLSAVDFAVHVDALPVLLRHLQHQNPDIEVEALWAIGLFEEKAEPAIPAVLSCCQSGDPRVRERAALTLGWIGRADPEVIDALLGNLSDEHRDVRNCAAWALGDLGAKARGAVPRLLSLLTISPEPTVCQAAAYVLGKVAEPSPDIIAALLDKLHCPDMPLWAVENSVSDLDPDGEIAEPLILAALEVELLPEVREKYLSVLKVIHESRSKSVESTHTAR